MALLKLCSDIANYFLYVQNLQRDALKKIAQMQWLGSSDRHNCQQVIRLGNQRHLRCNKYKFLQVTRPGVS